MEIKECSSLVIGDKMNLVLSGPYLQKIHLPSLGQQEISKDFQRFQHYFGLINKCNIKN